MDQSAANGFPEWPVFPCCPKSKRPLTARGFYDATQDKDEIAAFWRQHPDAMIGIPTGKRIGMFVLDLNPPDGMTVADCIAAIAAEIGCPLPLTKCAATPNGAHLYFRMPANCEIRNRGKLLEGAIDCVRGEGGYVIAPPSQRGDGVSYRWLDARPAAEAPQPLIDLIKPLGSRQEKKIDSHSHSIPHRHREARALSA